MEDAHLVDMDKGMFGVFDGHGGGEVAKFVANHLVEEFVALEEFKGSKVREGECFQKVILCFIY